MSLLPRNKWSKVLSGLFSSVTCSYANSERWTPGSGGRRAKPLPPCTRKPHASAVWRPVHSADQLTKPVWCTQEGTRGSMEAATAAASSAVPSDTCPQVCLQTCCRYSFELLSSLIIFFPTLRSDFRNTDQDRLFYFTFL